MLDAPVDQSSESRYQAGTQIMTRTGLLELIGERTREILPGLDEHQFVESDRLVDLGANSMDRAEIAMLVQESLGLSVARIELFGPRNIGELADLFLQKLDARRGIAHATHG
jgi:polyketide biosynthesis acyl carrier protein